jgi:hypothetical protein
MKAPTRYAAAFCLSLFCASAATAADWIALTEQACTTAGEAPLKCASSLALVRTAMSAAAPTTDGGGNGNGASGHPMLDEGASAVAAYVMLEHLYPDQQPEFEMRLAVALSDIPESQAKADALERGRRAATQILLDR